jgi:hypothetical protein
VQRVTHEIRSADWVAGIRCAGWIACIHDGLL